MNTKEYIVVLHSYTDLDDFYTDMEQYGHHEFVPNRPVELSYRRPTSRSTHYMLTDEEAERLKYDARVQAVIEPYYNQGIEFKPVITQYSTLWDKSTSIGPNNLNWGLLRGYEGTTRAGWGKDGTPTASGTINLPNIGKNVDVVIVDGHINPNHPEFAVNADGTGGSRVQQFNWFQYNAFVRGGNGAASNYVYDFMNTARAIQNNNHGTHVAGTAAGNTGGWARAANIFNISPYETSTINSQGHTNTFGFNVYLYDVIQYIRVWHSNKAINQTTGRRNPTVVNMSFGGARTFPIANIDRISYGFAGPSWTNVFRPSGGWTGADLDRYGLVWRPVQDSNGAITSITNGTSVEFAARDPSLDADIADAINDGIIFCGAAGNSASYMDVQGGPLFRSGVGTAGTFGGLVVYFVSEYMTGSSPGVAPGVICVGAVDSTVEERKAFYSNSGPRVDIFAPGSSIASSVLTQSDSPITTTTIAPPTTTTTTTAAPGVSYQFTSYSSSVNEGQNAQFYVSTTGVAPGTDLYYKVRFDVPSFKAADNSDFLSNGGNFQVGADGTASFVIVIRADMLTEGVEAFKVEIRTNYNDPNSVVAVTPTGIVINDTSQGTTTTTSGPTTTLAPVTTTTLAPVTTTTPAPASTNVDPRNSNFYRANYNGTSMACPQVTGIIACALETYPNMTPAQALSYIQTYANDRVLSDQTFSIDSTADLYKNFYILHGSKNKYAVYKPNTRPNQIAPIIGYKNRPLLGAVYPRPKVKQVFPEF